MITHHVEKTAYTSRAWLVVLTASLFFFYSFIQLNLFNSIDVPLMRDFNLDPAGLGQLASAYFYANAIFLFPAGILLDRFSTKKLLLMAVTFSTVGTFIFALANHYVIAGSARFVVGIGASFCFLSCIRLASRWFAPHRMALVTGIVVSIAMLGGMVAQTPFALLVEYLKNWRHAVLINAGLGVIIFFAIALIVQDRPPDAEEELKLDKEHLDTLGVLGCIKLSALNPQNWLGGIYTSLMNLPVFLLGALFGIHYLIEVRHITLVEASYATTLFFVGIIVGSPLFGWFSDWIGRRVLPMIIGSVLSLIVIISLMYLPNLSLWTIIILFFLIGLVTSSQVLTYPVIAELNPRYLTSTAVSIDSSCIMISGFIFQPLFGWIMELSGNHQVVNGVTIYTAENFNHAMLILPVSFFIALLITFFIRETYCNSEV